MLKHRNRMLQEVNDCDMEIFLLITTNKKLGWQSTATMSARTLWNSSKYIEMKTNSKHRSPTTKVVEFPEVGLPFTSNKMRRVKTVLNCHTCPKLQKQSDNIQVVVSNSVVQGCCVVLISLIDLLVSFSQLFKSSPHELHLPITSSLQCQRVSKQPVPSTMFVQQCVS